VRCVIPTLPIGRTKSLSGLRVCIEKRTLLEFIVGASANVQRPKVDMRPLPVLPARLNPLGGPGDERACLPGWLENV
jgi:hypothetical protein